MINISRCIFASVIILVATLATSYAADLVMTANDIRSAADDSNRLLFSSAGTEFPDPSLATRPKDFNPANVNNMLAAREK